MAAQHIRISLPSSETGPGGKYVMAAVRRVEDCGSLSPAGDYTAEAVSEYIAEIIMHALSHVGGALYGSYFDVRSADGSGWEHVMAKEGYFLVRN